MACSFEIIGRENKNSGVSGVLWAVMDDLSLFGYVRKKSVSCWLRDFGKEFKE